MYCSSCGSVIPANRMECPTCGARTPLAASVQPMAMRAPYGPQFAVDAPALCPRCRFMGPGMTYFTRGANLAKLAAWAFVTSWFFGFAGIIYFLSHKDDRVCPRCGQSWGKHGEVGHALAARMGALPAGAGAMPAVVDMDEGPEKWSGGAITAFVIAAIMAFAGIANFAAPPIILAMMLAGGGVFLQKHSRREREARREALLAALQQPVLQLAAQRRGRLTVTDVASQLGWPMPRAEKVLISLDDGVRVNSDVTDEGVIVYEFRELTHTPALGAPRSGIAPPQRQRPSASA